MLPNMLKSAFWAEAFLSKWKNTSFMVSCLVFTFWFWYNIKISWCLLCFLAVICAGLLVAFSFTFAPSFILVTTFFLSPFLPLFSFLCVCVHILVSPLASSYFLVLLSFSKSLLDLVYFDHPLKTFWWVLFTCMELKQPLSPLRARAMQVFKKKSKFWETSLKFWN